MAAIYVNQLQPWEEVSYSCLSLTACPCLTEVLSGGERVVALPICRAYQGG